MCGRHLGYTLPAGFLCVVRLAASLIDGFSNSFYRIVIIAIYRVLTPSSLVSSRCKYYLSNERNGGSYCHQRQSPLLHHPVSPSNSFRRITPFTHSTHLSLTSRSLHHLICLHHLLHHIISSPSHLTLLPPIIAIDSNSLEPQ